MFEHTIPETADCEGLLDDIVFVDGHLACAISTGVSAYGWKLWDLARRERVVDHETSEISGRYVLSSPPASSLVVVVAAADRVVVWDVREGRARYTFAVVEAVCGAFHPDSQRFAHAEFGRVQVHDANGARLASWSVPGDVESLTWVSGGRWLVGQHASERVQVWDAADGSPLATLDLRGEILASSPCGRWVALADGIVSLDDLAVRRVSATAAVFDAASSSFVLADRDRVWRVRV